MEVELEQIDALSLAHGAASSRLPSARAEIEGATAHVQENGTDKFFQAAAAENGTDKAAEENGTDQLYGAAAEENWADKLFQVPLSHGEVATLRLPLHEVGAEHEVHARAESESGEPLAHDEGAALRQPLNVVGADHELGFGPHLEAGRHASGLGGLSKREAQTVAAIEREAQRFMNISLFPSAATILLGLVTTCVLCGCLYCSKLRLRDCRCLARCMRCCGCDRFNTFDVTVVVHDIDSKDSLKDKKLAVRLAADRGRAQTAFHKKGVFEENLKLVVEQGVTEVRVEIVDCRGNVKGLLRLDTVHDIVETGHVWQKVYKMEQTCKDLTGPQIRLSLFLEGVLEHKGAGGQRGEAVKALQDEGMSVTLQAQLLAHAPTDADAGDNGPRSLLQAELDILAKAAQGPLQMSHLHSLGNFHEVFVTVAGPPKVSHYELQIYASKQHLERGEQPQKAIRLLRVIGVAPDPKRDECFGLKFADKDKNIITAQFKRVDRARDVWVEYLDLLVSKVREMKAKRAEEHGK